MKTLEPNTYLDLAKLPLLVELVEEFCSQPISAHLVDIGLQNEGTASGYSAVVIYDVTGDSTIGNDLGQLVQSITAYSGNIQGVDRIFVNFLNPNSSVPVHLEDPSLPEYNEDDSVSFNYNIIVPVTTHGSHIVDNTTLVAVKGSPIIFNGQVLHGTTNESEQTHIWITMIVNSLRIID